MQVFITKKYLTVLFALEFAWIACLMVGMESWITAGFFSMFMIHLGHEWVHAIISQLNGLTVERICLEGLRGDSHTVFLSGNVKKDSQVILSGAIWDGYWYYFMIANMMIAGLKGTDSFAIFFAAPAMAVIFWISTRLPSSDWQRYLMRTKQGA